MTKDERDKLREIEVLLKYKHYTQAIDVLRKMRAEGEKAGPEHTRDEVGYSGGKEITRDFMTKRLEAAIQF